MTRSCLFSIKCPLVKVTNTGRWWNFVADREHEDAECTGEIELWNDITVPITIVFPKVLVKYKSFWEWTVDPTKAVGVVDYSMTDDLGIPLSMKGEIWIQFPPEPATRYYFDFFAQPVDSIDGEINVTVVVGTEDEGTKMSKKGKVRATLPLVRARSVWLGMRKFVVDAVDIPGTVEWLD